MLQILTVLGKIDGGLAAAVAGWGLYDPAHSKEVMLGVAITGAAGMILNGLAHYFGGGDVVAPKGGQS